MTRKKCRTCVVPKEAAGCLFGCDAVQRVGLALDRALRQEDPKDLIEEQLRECPQAFKAGDMLNKLFDQLRYDRAGEDRLLPPVGVVTPPLV
jgi:hypothetical protein